MKIAVCSDHAGFALKAAVINQLRQKGHEVTDFGTNSEASCDYPDFAHPCAAALEKGEADFAIGICGSGNGIAMTLNKHQGIRAAICWQTELAALARQHNDANCLVLPARFISQERALDIVNVFFASSFEGGRHVRRVEKIPVAD